MLRPQLPPTVHPTTVITSANADQAACSCHHSPAPARRSLPTVSNGAIAVVLLGGVVLTGLLTAVAVSAISVAVAAVVMRSLLAQQKRR